MSGTHRYPTISFRVSPAVRDAIEAKIKVSGLQKKDYFIRSCINNRVCVVGKEEHILHLINELKMMQLNLQNLAHHLQSEDRCVLSDDLAEMKSDYVNMIGAIKWMLDGAEYMWKDNEKVERFVEEQDAKDNID